VNAILIQHSLKFVFQVLSCVNCVVNNERLRYVLCLLSQTPNEMPYDTPCEMVNALTTISGII
jgi:hypothetical protein